MTTRLSMSNLAGTVRTEVAVGTSSEDCMLTTTRAAGPRSGRISASDGGGVDFGAGMSRGMGAVGAGAATGAAPGATGAPGVPAEPATTGVDGAGAGAGVGADTGRLGAGAGAAGAAGAARWPFPRGPDGWPGR